MGYGFSRLGGHSVSIDLYRQLHFRARGGAIGIVQSVVKPTHTVIVREGRSSKLAKRVYLSDICTSGGIINAYNALKLAATY